MQDLFTLPVVLRDRRPDDIPTMQRWLTDPRAEWRRWDSPYSPAEQTTETMQAYIRFLQATAPEADERVIDVDGEVVGLVNRDQEEPEGNGWWDLGILIFNPHYWGGGVGTRALRLWVQDTLDWTDAHTLTFTTWSGNERMIRAALRLGFRECMRVREARVVGGERFDSVRYDLLRREWEAAQLS
ncbi:GNAT family protein [Deinococcus sp.]|uniref:GNAT family N-acetyltransferase n=1 Tax=Deinococcus sp. TaxID=47478 RepID=UPI0025BEA137|nr:GNAT family protein [Deinococcus sp.]